MLDYNSLDEMAKRDFKKHLEECAQAIGGKNYFLQLVESIRDTRPHPLMAKNARFQFSQGNVKWQKVIYKDKVHLLIKLLGENQTTGNLMPKKGDKGFKTVMNLLRTLGPMKFEVNPKNKENGDGFILHPFDRIDNKTTHLNYIFDAVFFMPMYVVKKALTGSGKKKKRT
jgi:hypothetical protein